MSDDFFTSSDPRLPNQIPVPGTTSAHEAQEAQRRLEAWPARLRSLILRFAIYEGVVLVGLVWLCFLSGLIEAKNAGLVMVIGALVLCFVPFTYVIVKLARERAALAATAAVPVASAVPGISSDPTAFGQFALGIEDVFQITGRGLVATGKVTAGAVGVDQDVLLVRDGVAIARGRVTGIEAFRRVLSAAGVGEHVGILLAGLGDVRPERGDELRAG